MNNNIRYIHAETKKGKCYATFALNWEKKIENNINVLDVNLGVSFCSPHDQFEKSIGKKKAFGRANTPSKMVKLRIENVSSSKYITNLDFELLLKEFIKDRLNLYPTWVKTAVTKKEIGFGTKKFEINE
jgi:hypothetical protein